MWARLSWPGARLAGLLGLLIVGLLIFLGNFPAVTAKDQAGRYTMSPIEGGFLRLDTQTGRVSVCQKRGEAWVCETVADDRAALEDEIARLKKENQALRRRLAELGETPPPAAGREDQLAPALPSEEDVDRLFGVIEHFIQRFQDMMKRLKEQEKSETPL